MHRYVRFLKENLHPSLQDGNLLILEEELSAGDVNLEEQTYGPLAYTPLFIAFMNDHFQVGITLADMYMKTLIPTCIETTGCMQLQEAVDN